MENQNSAAYKLEDFNAVKMPYRKPKKNNFVLIKGNADNAYVTSAMIRMFLCIFTFLAILVSIIVFNVLVTETQDAITTYNSKIESLENDYSYYNSKVELLSNNSNLEKYALSHGYCKIQDYQVTYVSTDKSTSKTIRTEKAPTGSFFEDVTNVIDNIILELKIK